jgi:hypothetical protein
MLRYRISMFCLHFSSRQRHVIAPSLTKPVHVGLTGSSGAKPGLAALVLSPAVQASGDPSASCACDMSQTTLGSQGRGMLWHHVDGINYAVEASGERYLKLAYLFPFDPLRTILGKLLTDYSFSYFGYACIP